ncbi:cobalamin biosynthesis protein CobT [Bradyrhizobium sp. USDA 4486]
MRRAYPHLVELSADRSAVHAAQTEFDWLTEQHQTADELPDEVDARYGELETNIELLEAKRQAYGPGHVARGGAFVILNHDGTIRIERDFICPGDDKPDAETGQDNDGKAPDEEGGGDDQATRDGKGEGGENEEEEEEQSLSDTLVRDLTASNPGAASQSE